MARLISDILGASEPHFRQELDRLEALAGHPREDLKLVSELASKWQELAAGLGLDGRDTTIEELYYAMQLRAHEENEKVARVLGVQPDDTPEKMVESVVSWVNQRLEPSSVWSLKNSVAKQQLKACPPKKLLKIWGLRSIDSALKREHIAQLMIFAEMVEGKIWNDNFIRMAARLRNSDFDKKRVSISIMKRMRTEKLQKNGVGLGRLVYRNSETGGIAVVVPARRFTGDTLYFVDALIREVNEIRRWSSFAKYLSVRPGFGKWLSAMRAYGLDHAAVRHFKIGWTPLHQLLHKKAFSERSSLIEPHLDHEDVRLVKHELGPLWQHTYLLKTQGGLVVSCNVSDVIINAVNKAPPSSGVVSNGRKELYSELFSRYLAHEAVLDDFLGR